MFVWGGLWLSRATFSSGLPFPRRLFQDLLTVKNYQPNSRFRNGGQVDKLPHVAGVANLLN